MLPVKGSFLNLACGWLTVPTLVHRQQPEKVNSAMLGRGHFQSAPALKDKAGSTSSSNLSSRDFEGVVGCDERISSYIESKFLSWQVCVCPIRIKLTLENPDGYLG